MKSFLHRWFGFGRLAADVRSALDAEGLLLLDEGVAASVTRINYRDNRGWRCSWNRRSLTATVAVTRTRLAALNHRGNYFINVPREDPRLARMRIEAEREDLLLIAFDVTLFHPDWQGLMECRFRTPLAGRIVAELR